MHKLYQLYQKKIYLFLVKLGVFFLPYSFDFSVTVPFSNSQGVTRYLAKYVTYNPLLIMQHNL